MFSAGSRGTLNVHGVMVHPGQPEAEGSPEGGDVLEALKETGKEEMGTSSF